MDNAATPIPLGPEVEVDDGTRIEAFAIISEVSATLADEDDVEELLGRFLGTMLRLAHATAGVVRVLTTDSRHLRLVGARGLPPDLVERERVVPIDCGHCGSAVRDNRCHYEIDLQDCATRTGNAYFGHECQAMVVVPLQHGGRLLGTYNLFLRERFSLPEELVGLFRSIGEHLGMALENARLKRENMRIALMNERAMMAAEVHDSLAQTCAYMKMRVALLTDALRDGEVSQPHGSDGSAARAGRPRRWFPRSHWYPPRVSQPRHRSALVGGPGGTGILHHSGGARQRCPPFGCDAGDTDD
jgi:two-component system nitrate/nitrite sensor histidine kinase NarX